MGDIDPVIKSKDPVSPCWAAMQLPDAWPDQLNLRNPVHMWKVFSHVFKRGRQPVKVPEGLPGRENIPKYILQEFHNLPNGNYSKKLTRGYITGFDRAMLGRMRTARQTVASAFKGLGSVLDVGCAGGRMSDAIKSAGVEEVWGLDPSVYLLQHAAHDYPDIHFVQGIAENTPFPDQRFEGIAACFVLHEIPPKYLQHSIAEFYRILKPGGVVALCEPSVEQMKLSLWDICKAYGLVGVYFSCMARSVYEPFVDAWHKRDIKTLFNQCGFELLKDEADMPVRHIVARKCL